MISASPKKIEGDQIMATQTASADAFYKQLGRMYGVYTGGFVAFVVLLGIMEYAGVPNKIIGPWSSPISWSS